MLFLLAYSAFRFLDSYPQKKRVIREVKDFSIDDRPLEQAVQTAMRIVWIDSRVWFVQQRARNFGQGFVGNQRVRQSTLTAESGCANAQHAYQQYISIRLATAVSVETDAIVLQTTALVTAVAGRIVFNLQRKERSIIF